MINGRTVFALKELANRAMMIMITAATADFKIRWRDVEYVTSIYPEVYLHIM